MRELDEIFAALKRSTFRSRLRLGEADRRYLHGRGLEKVLEHARRFVGDRLAAAEPVNDGKQTPMRGHPVFVAQHATATCCRACLMKWHGIETGRPLTPAEQAYVVSVIGRWLAMQGAAEDTSASDGQQGLF